MCKFIPAIWFLLLSFAATASAQETFLFTDKSKIYDVKVALTCDEEICNDRATFYLLKKNQKTVFQAIEMPETYLSLNGKQKMRGGLTELSGDGNSGVYFADYNFDGIDDLAISNGNYAPYGGISLDVFLFSKEKQKFVKDEELTALESFNMSVELNRKLKIIETQTKSGCCWHERARYRYVKNRLQKFYVFTEDATSGDGRRMKLVTERLIRGRWRRTTRTVSVK